MDTTIALVHIALLICWNTYWFTSMWISTSRRRGNRAPDVVYLLWSATKWPALIAILASPFYVLYLGEDLGFWDYLGLVVGIIAWWIYRNEGDDDVWKRFKRRAKEKIAQVGSRLVVVPEPA